MFSLFIFSVGWSCVYSCICIFFIHGQITEILLQFLNKFYIVTLFMFLLSFCRHYILVCWSAVVIQVSRFKSLDNIILLKILQKDFLVFSVAQLKSVSGKFSQIGF